MRCDTQSSLRYEELKAHKINMPEDWEGEFPLFCEKCGKKAVMRTDLIWVCPELYKLDRKYFNL